MGDSLDCLEYLVMLHLADWFEDDGVDKVAVVAEAARLLKVDKTIVVAVLLE